MGKKLRTVGLNSKFTGSYKKRVNGSVGVTNEEESLLGKWRVK